MRKVSSPSLKQLFKYHTSISEVWDLEKEFSIHNPFTFTFILSLALLLAGLFNRHALFMGISLSVSLLTIYLLLRSQSRRIFLKREIPRSSSEYLRTRTKVRIINNSSFPILNYTLYDTFTGSQTGGMVTQSMKPISSLSTRTVVNDWYNDGGMGEKEFKELLLDISDPLDFIRFSIYEDHIDTIPIYPHYEFTPSIALEHNLNSSHYGEIDVQKRGESINFMGIREYRKGDSVKRINWKQTAKQKKTIVNLFERNINKSVMLLYNNALEIHSGLAAESTEEYLKDLILSIAADNISNGNHLKLITQKSSTPWGAQKSFINRLELFLLDLKLESSIHPEKFIEETLKKEAGEELRHSSLFYFTPIVASTATEKTFEYILSLSSTGIPIKIIAINPYSYVDGHFHYGSFSGVKGHIVASQKMIKKWSPLFRKNGISFFVIDIDPKMNLKQKMQKAWRSFETKA